MTVPLHPDDLRVGESVAANGRVFVVEYAADASVLEAVCKEARRLVEFKRDIQPGLIRVTTAKTTPKPVATLHLNGEGMEGVKRDAFLLAMKECGGRLAHVAKRLKIQKSTAYDYAKRYLKTLLVLSVLQLAGCVSAPDPVTPGVRTQIVAAMPARVMTAAASQPAVTNSVTLAWDASPDTRVAGYKLYYGASSGAYSKQVDVGNVTNATLNSLVWRSTYYFAAAAYDTNGLESVFSNEAVYTVPQPPQPLMTAMVYTLLITWPCAYGITNTLQTSTNLAQWYDYASFVGTNGTAKLMVTNSSDQQFWRVKL